MVLALRQELGHFLQQRKITMETGIQEQFAWERRAFVASDSIYMNHQHKNWTAFGSSSEQTLSTSSYPLMESTENRDQFTTYEELFHSKLFPEFVREASVQAEQPRDETLFPEQQSDGFQQRQKSPLAKKDTQKPSSKRLHASKQLLSHAIEPNNSAPQPVTDCEPVKRKRGRPRLYSHPVDVQNLDSSSIHVSSARKLRLEKNRVAADKCRQRRREYTTRLVANVSKLSFHNKELKADETFLRQQVLDLKNELLGHARCGSWAIDRYIAQSAGNIFGLGAPPIHVPALRGSNQTQNSTVSIDLMGELPSETVTESLPSQASSDSSIESDAYDDLRFLNDYEKMEEQ